MSEDPLTIVKRWAELDALDLDPDTDAPGGYDEVILDCRHSYGALEPEECPECLVEYTEEELFPDREPERVRCARCLSWITHRGGWRKCPECGEWS